MSVQSGAGGVWPVGIGPHTSTWPTYTVNCMPEGYALTVFSALFASKPLANSDKEALTDVVAVANALPVAVSDTETLSNNPRFDESDPVAISAIAANTVVIAN